VGLVAPAIQEGEHVQEAGALTTPATILRQALGLRLRERRRIRPGEAPFATDWLCGALLLGRTGQLRELGGFDPRFFLYFEETDLCRRMLRRGLELWAVGEAVAVHEGGGSTARSRVDLVGGCIPEHFFRSRYYYLVKHWSRLIAVPTELAELTVLGVRWVLRRLRGRHVDDLRVRLRRPILRLPDPPAARP
jgi:GT2 family glycosyltransferase